MFRLKKLLWILIVLWIVFFIICDEKWYKIWFNDNQIVFNKIEKKINFVESEKIEQQFDLNVIYKNSDLIQINYEFQNPKTLRYGIWIDKKRLAQIKEEKKLEEKIIQKQSITSTWERDLALNDYSEISSLFKWLTIEKNGKAQKNIKNGNKTDDNVEGIETWNRIMNNESTLKSWTDIKISENSQIEQSNKTWFEIQDDDEKIILYYPVEKYYHNNHTLDLKKGEFIEDIPENIETYTWKSLEIQISNLSSLLNVPDNNENDSISNHVNLENISNQRIGNSNQQTPAALDTYEERIQVTPDSEEGSEINDALYKVEKYIYTPHLFNIKKAIKIEENTDINYIDEKPIINYEIEEVNNQANMNELNIPDKLIKIKKYQPKKHSIYLRKWLPIEHKFTIESVENKENWLSDSMLENLLKNEEIDISTLESENDEFLQEIFAKTKDVNIMNLIVETYLDEYQFVKAKKFIERLPESYNSKLKPSLNLRVAFNSFPLSSKTFDESLISLISDYSSKNEISAEDKNRYLWVLALIDRNYEKFFEISKWFSSAKNKAFAVKLQWYKDQISKQMWMPDYYFDTLVSLELFNQWLFQPAKVLALYSLQNNSNYILPYQVLAYANFLTNSRDTANEYLKKLVELDPTNAEKYRFLMWVASYRNGKYEQSVVMLSLVKNNNLRLDAQRYLINNYLQLRQNNKLISSRNKLLWYENLVASDFYTYFYEVFFHPYSEWSEFILYALDTDLANKMLRMCTNNLPKDESVVCTYWTIGRNIALWQFDGIEQYLLNLVSEYPQWYLYQALGDYYIQQWEPDKAKTFLLKAVSLTQKRKEVNQIKKLLQETM